MSYRDLRNFTEMMRSLGYTRLISMENFRNPNFQLVAEILIWIVKRFDPDADIPSEIDTEQDRVILVKSAAQFMASKANIKLNTKRIYQADGYAVRELLKVTSVLYSALRVNMASLGDNSSSLSSPVDISSKIHELAQTRQLASQITARGAGLYDLLGKEVEMRELRNMCVSRQLEMAEVEASVRKALETVKMEIANKKQQMENVSASEANLDSKIEKKQTELDRNKKRLQTLKKVRPAFLEEFERLEVELQQLYQDYLVRFRCVAYLEQQQEEAEQAEHERMEARKAYTKRLLEQMRQEDKLLESSVDLFEPGEVKEGDEVSKLGVGKASRVRIKTASGVMRKASAAGQQTRRVFGSMNAPPDEEEDSGSLDSDSDLLLDGEGSELLGSEEEDEELELGLDVAVNKDKHSTSRLQQEHSDDDF
ncbi:clusterin-associated protein 1-like [Zootermopsis nevadensis]|uniref:Clusterin-associated protein 1 n=1 Tax=Zootermopsis nevadensis TaxID=136037 RepID=A0A067QVA1_ZOONE|nr:clusterin-associated protein 1-like [Zootermopsis nevadensis]KDR13000.1 Clusterin-associated protein 1 [Zootermopsis nevadensis]